MITFEQRAPHFHFAVSSINEVAGPAAASRCHFPTPLPFYLLHVPEAGKFGSQENFRVGLLKLLHEVLLVPFF